MTENILYQKSPWLNPSFKLKDMPEYGYKRRYDFGKLMSYLTGTKLMVHIRGLRRLGKSTLMKQAIIDLIEKQGIDPKKILFFEFSPSNNDLSAILNDAPKNGFIFLDEVQYCTNWRDTLKLYYDNNYSYNSRIVFSGSATMSYIASKESLLGRFLPINLKTLSFDEYIYLKYSSTEAIFYNTVELKEFMEFGEFPELLSINDKTQKRDYLVSSILAPMFTKDVSLYAVEKKAEFSAVYKLVVANMGQVVSKQNIASLAGITRPSLDKYLDVMQDMGLITLVPNFHKSVGKTLGSNKKVYSLSLNLALAHLGFVDFDGLPLPGFKGSIFENFVYTELYRQFDSVYYWKRDRKELDFICHTDKIALISKAYEVKARRTMGAGEVGMYTRYANEVVRGVGQGAKVEFKPILWNFDTKASALLEVIKANALNSHNNGVV